MNSKYVPWILVAIIFCMLAFFGIYILSTMPNSPIHISFGNEPPQVVTQLPAQPNNPQPQPEQPTNTPVPTWTPAPTWTPQPTYTLQPTYTPAPTQVQEAMFTTNQPAFCRTGPSEQIWPEPQEGLSEGQTVKIVGKSSSEWGLWWYIEKASGSRCWVYSELGSTSGNVAGVPIKTAPATPTPAPTAEYVYVNLTNNQGVNICNVWLKPHSGSSWTDLLSGGILPPGGTLTFYTSPGKYDIEIYDCGGVMIDSGNGVKIDAGHANWWTP